MGTESDKDNEIGNRISGYYRCKTDKWMAWVDVEQKQFELIFDAYGEHRTKYKTPICGLPIFWPRNYVFMGTDPNCILKYKLEEL